MLAVILPIAVTIANRQTGKLSGAYYAMVGGTLFALATVPGPVAHDKLVGRGTWFANQLTQDVRRRQRPGAGAPLCCARLHVTSASVRPLPVYIGLMWLLWSGASRARARAGTEQSTVDSVVSQA